MATTKVTTDVIDMSGNAGGLTWVKGTTAQQPSGVIGEIREDTDTKRTQVYTNQLGAPPSISTCDYPAGAGAQALYQFDTATLTTDTCGNYSAGTNNNVTQNTTVKKFGTSSAEFNGTTADIDLESGLDSTTMSVSFWIYIDATITTNGVVVELENGYGVWFIASASGKLGVQNNNANNEATLSNAQLGTGAWHHVAAVWTGVGGSSNRTFYLDNQVQTGGTVSDYLTCNENTLGSRRSGEFFDGYLDQVRFYNTALTASQVDDLFNETSTSTGNEWRNLKETSVGFNVDFLVIAGGGGGGAAPSGNIGAGGGGAGGYRNSFNNENSGGGGSSESSLSLGTGIAYNIEVGAGGAGAVSNAFGASGGNSIFASITSIGGGGGANYDAAGSTGGSGGGSYVLVSGGIGNNPGLGTNTTNGDATNQGFNGGTVVDGSSSGGGGGAGSIGVNSRQSSPSQTGNGGNGLESEISGSPVTRAGGGGGGRYSTEVSGPGTGGTGGGGAGGSISNGGDASSANTGSGGGGGADSYSGGSGSSGIIILRTALSSAAFTAGVQVNGVTTSAGQVISPSAQGDGTHIYSITIAGAGATITFS